MKNIKNILALILVLCMALSLIACGQAPEAPETVATTEATNAPETTEAAPIDDGKTEYKVIVVDEGGNPVANAMVQICKDSCLPGMTNAEGVATFNVAEEEGYKISFMTMPAGYEADAEEFYFEAGATEITIVLKAVA